MWDRGGYYSGNPSAAPKANPETLMPGPTRSRRSPTLRTLALGVALALIAAACGSATSTPDATANCDHWCGNGSARITVAGATTPVTGGGCYDTGATGIDARFGDWGNNGVGDFVSVTGYRAGDPTPTPAPTPARSSAQPGADTTDHPGVTVDGSVGGVPFVLTTAQVTFAADGTGSFSGTDQNGSGDVSGTFSCK
jgi:hypothetical protein